MDQASCNGSGLPNLPICNKEHRNELNSIRSVRQSDKVVQNGRLMGHQWIAKTGLE